MPISYVSDLNSATPFITFILLLLCGLLQLLYTLYCWVALYLTITMLALNSMKS